MSTNICHDRQINPCPYGMNECDDSDHRLDGACIHYWHEKARSQCDATCAVEPPTPFTDVLMDISPDSMKQLRFVKRVRLTLDQFDDEARSFARNDEAWQWWQKVKAASEHTAVQNEHLSRIGRDALIKSHSESGLL